MVSWLKKGYGLQDLPTLVQFISFMRILKELFVFRSVLYICRGYE